MKKAKSGCPFSFGAGALCISATPALDLSLVQPACRARSCTGGYRWVICRPNPCQIVLVAGRTHELFQFRTVNAAVQVSKVCGPTARSYELEEISPSLRFLFTTKRFLSLRQASSSAFFFLSLFPLFLLSSTLCGFIVLPLDSLPCLFGVPERVGSSTTAG